MRLNEIGDTPLTTFRLIRRDACHRIPGRRSRPPSPCATWGARARALPPRGRCPPTPASGGGPASPWGPAQRRRRPPRPTHGPWRWSRTPRASGAPGGRTGTPRPAPAPRGQGGRPPAPSSLRTPTARRSSSSPSPDKPRDLLGLEGEPQVSLLARRVVSPECRGQTPPSLKKKSVPKHPVLYHWYHIESSFLYLCRTYINITVYFIIFIHREEIV